MIKAAQSTSLVVVLAIAFLAPPAFAAPRVVNCDDGDSLQKALDSGAGSAKRLEIELLGTCYESVTLSRDHVAISGDGNTTIVGQFRLFSSDQVFLTNLNITGPGAGIRATNGRLRMTYVNIFGNENEGIVGGGGAVINLRWGSINDNNGAGAFVTGSTLTVRNAEVARNAGDGIFAGMNSSVSAVDVNIHENGSSGVAASMGSAIEVNGSQIWGNGFMGAHLTNGSRGYAEWSQFNGNAVNGIDLTGNSNMDLHSAQLGWNGDNGAWVSEHSLLRLDNTAVEYNWHHGLGIHRDGGVVAGFGSRINGNVEFFQVVCHGAEASIEVDGTVDLGFMDCTHPDF
jgi:hypothetical protein